MKAKKIRNLILLSILCTAALPAHSERSPTEGVDGCCATSPFPSNTGFITPDPILNSPKVWSFISAPNLRPMKITVNKIAGKLAAGYIFVAPYSFSSDPTYGQSGSLIIDNAGNPIWFRPMVKNLMNTDFRVQRFCGKPVLTF